MSRAIKILALCFAMAVPARGANAPTRIRATSPLTITSGLIALPAASSSQNGYLLATDWDTFNSKLDSLTQGNLTSATTGLTVTGGTSAVIGSGTSLTIQTASGSQPGLLSAANWTTFNGKAPNLLTGFSAAAGTVAATDTVVQGFNKVVGNIALKADKALVEEINFHVPSPGTSTIYLVQKASYARQIDKIAVRCLSGGHTLAVQIDGVDITTCNGISVSSSESETTCNTGSSNDLPAGATLSLVPTSDSSCTAVVGTVQTTRD